MAGSFCKYGTRVHCFMYVYINLTFFLRDCLNFQWPLYVKMRMPMALKPLLINIVQVVVYFLVKRKGFNSTIENGQLLERRLWISYIFYSGFECYTIDGEWFEITRFKTCIWEMTRNGRFNFGDPCLSAMVILNYENNPSRVFLDVQTLKSLTF